MKFNFSLDGVVKPSFIRVKEVRRSILPPISQNTSQVPGRPGNIDFGNEIGALLIEMKVIIMGNGLNSLQPLVRQFADYLYHENPVRLEIDDEPGFYYMAKVTGDTYFDELLTIGEATISFLCSDPFAHKEELTFNVPKPYTGQVIQISNLGTAPTAPVIKLNIAKDITALNVISGDSYVSLGSALGYGETAVPEDPYVLKEGLFTLNGWSQAPTSNVNNVVFGTEGFEVFDNTGIRPKVDAWNGKFRDGYYGGTIERGLLASPEDWEFTVIMKFNGKTTRGAGLGGVTLTDANGTPMVSMDVIDWDRGVSMGTARFSLLSRDGSSRKWLGQATLPEVYKDFVGYLTCRKQGNKFTTKVAVCTAKNPGSYKNYEKWSEYKVLKTDSYVDGNGTYFKGRKPYKAQIFSATYGTIDSGDKDNNNKVCNMGFYDIYVKNLDKKAVVENTKPIIASSGDVIEIHNDTGEIYKNGLLWYDYFSPQSTFIKLKKKESGLVIEPYDAVDGGTITYVPAFY